MYDLVIVGAGGCGREVYEMALETFSPQEYHIKGFLSDDRTVLDGFPDLRADVPIIDTIVDYEVKPQDRFLLAIGDPAGRKLVAGRMKAKGAQFLQLIHPTARVFATAVLGEGTIVYPFVFLSSYVRVGDFCLFNAYSGCGHDAVIGDFSVFCPFAVVLGFGQLGEGCFLSTHAMLAPKKKLGRNVVVSANSSALRNAEDDTFICGVPGKNM